MSIIISGIDMPTNCTRCPCSDDGARFCRAANKYIPMFGKPNFCPLVKAEERKTGKWLPDNNNYYEERFICSVCGKSYKVDTCMGKPMWDFCPCGADMRGEEHGT